MIDLVGFGSFAFYWISSWGRSLIVFLWAALLFFSSREASKTEEIQLSTTQETETVKDVTLRWFVSRLGIIIIALVGLIAVIYAWGGKQAVLINVYTALKTPFSIGNWQLSVMNLVFAIAALFITHAIAGTWRQFFQNTFLSDSGIDPGVKESVSTISFYLLWFFGILISLNFFGMNMKSVAVIFGALGLGLGFGLQTIFNNFISGIILLFERPIQVGDDVEIDGVWATVKKINVRSTVVQTYDNATLIIPNSDFISTKVINWSFKDKRLRRRIDVGVAYGSDIELVRKTLLEIAAATPRILRVPKPEVLFSEFGDSALLFALRIWTRVDYFLAVETEVRFEINRLFKERNIEIAFPQMDLHVRSINNDTLSQIKPAMMSPPRGETS
jgi:small-conductance mechanosensitive channel